MYEEFYGLSRKPFALTPDPDFLFLSKNHAVALAMLEYGVQGQAALSLITGEVGSNRHTINSFLSNIRYCKGMKFRSHRLIWSRKCI